MNVNPKRIIGLGMDFLNTLIVIVQRTAATRAFVCVFVSLEGFNLCQLPWVQTFNGGV